MPVAHNWEAALPSPNADGQATRRETIGGSGKDELGDLPNGWFKFPSINGLKRAKHYVSYGDIL
jgi:hypothetical protein